MDGYLNELWKGYTKEELAKPVRTLEVRFASVLSSYWMP